jgi:Domain of Unknown Function with PDB structure (DUF3857)
MIKSLSAILLCTITLCVKAQTTAVKAPAQFKEVQPYGQVDMEDLEMKTCDFEPNANAEVLFDVGNYKSEGETALERHTRIKIFNEAGKNKGSVRFEYVSHFGQSTIKGLEAETINLENGKIVKTSLDPKGYYVEKIDNYFSALVFALPNVKVGSIIEYKFKISSVRGVYYPNWYFQSNIPTRYSEIKTDFPGGAIFRVIPHIKQPFAKSIGKIDDYTQTRALVNIPALPEEPFAGAEKDNLQHMEYLFFSGPFNSWDKIGRFLVRAQDVGVEFDNTIPGGSEIVKKAKTLKTDDEKIGYIFDTVRNAVKWNDISHPYVTDGCIKTWDRKTGNSAEINFIVLSLLRRAGIKAFPMMVSTNKNGRLNPINVDMYSFNSAVVYIPVDSTHYYVLDATNKYNLFNEVPVEELNGFGFNLDESASGDVQREKKNFQIIFLQNTEPAIQSVFINADILADGKLKGNTEINSYSYHKINALTRYHEYGLEKYQRYLSNNDNNTKISGLKLEGATVDSIPLTQKFNFDVDLTSSDEHYIYFNANLFTLMGENPFKKEERFSDIDFGYRDNYVINSLYKIPPGFKADSLPKSVTIVMPDTSIIFKRVVAQNEGTILVKYSLNHKKTIYFREDYQDIRGFYKKMYDLLSERLILKKE